MRSLRGRIAILLTAVAFLAAPVGGRLSASASTGPDSPAGPPGALFGQFPGPNRPLYPATNANYVNGLPDLGVGPDAALSYLPAMQRWQGRADDVINVYSEWAGASPFLFGYWLPSIWDRFRAVPMITLYGQEPNATFMTNRSIADGDYDPIITAWALELRQFIFGTDANGQPAPPGGRRAYIRWDWEGNARFAPWSASGGATTCEELAANETAYLDQWRHVHDLIMATGGFSPQQVAWVFSVWSESAEVPQGCPDGASELVRSMYPGDEYVDWVGVDGYGLHPFNPGMPPAELFDPMVNELRSITSRPMSLNEVGVGTWSQADLAPLDPMVLGASPADKDQWIADYFAYVARRGIKMTLWFNVDKEADWAVFSQAGNPADPLSRGSCTDIDAGVTYNAYCAYAEGIRSPYFVAPDPANPRLLSDAQFLGSGATVNPSPAAGRVHDTVTVSGDGFAANAPLTATFDGAPVPISGTTDAGGRIGGATLLVPPRPPGRYVISIADDSGVRAEAAFTIDP